MPTDLHLDILKDVRIASPCPARWEDMRGDNKTRHCEQCNLSVHDFSAMTLDEIDSILRAAGGTSGSGRVCARLFRRADGTIITADCPVGLAAVRAKARRAMARAVAAAGVLVTAGVLWAQGKDRPWDRARLTQLEPFASVYKRLAGTPPQIAVPLGGVVRAPSYNINPSGNSSATGE